MGAAGAASSRAPPWFTSFDDAAGDSIAGIPGGLAFVVVRAGMDDDGGAVVVERHRVERQAGAERLHGQHAVALNMGVGQVARMRAAVRQDAVFGVSGKVAAGGGEVFGYGSRSRSWTV